MAGRWRKRGRGDGLLWGLGWGVVGIFAKGFPWVWGRGGPSPGWPSALLQGSGRVGRAVLGGGVICLSGFGLPCRGGGVSALPVLGGGGGSAGWLGFLGGGGLLCSCGVLRPLADLGVRRFSQLLTGEQSSCENRSNRVATHLQELNLDPMKPL